MSQPPYKLLPIDSDPIFLLGLQTLCEQFPDLEIVDRVSDTQQAIATLERLAQEQNPERLSDAEIAPQPSPSKPVDLVVLAIDWSGIVTDATGDSTPISELHHRYPQVPLLLLGHGSYLQAIAPIAHPNVKGYCTKGIPGSELLEAIRQVASGGTYWVTLPSAAPSQVTGGVLSTLLQQVRRSGLRQINTELQQIQASLQNQRLSELDRLFWEGRQRELLAARWMVDKLLAPPVSPPLPLSKSTSGGRVNPRSGESQQNGIGTPRRIAGGEPPVPVSDRAIQVRAYTGELLSPSTEADRTLQTQIFDAIADRINSSLDNHSGVVLEIDILRPEKKRELLYTVLRQFEAVLAQLRYSQVQAHQLAPKRDRILLDLWELSVSEYFGKYYSLGVGEGNSFPQNLQEFELVPILLQDGEIVGKAILEKIPLLLDLLAYLLYQIPLVIDSVTYPPDSPEAIHHAEILLENVVIQVANGVMQPLLNRFANVEAIAQNLFARPWRSTREIERFRNDLSWKYRRQNTWIEPKAIFESQYFLFAIAERGIKQIWIYAPRNQELAEMQGLRLVVTLLLETRDAISPRIKSILMSLGSGARYLLIQLGRGIGLIGRGIIQGIGNSLQENRFQKNKEE